MKNNNFNIEELLKIEKATSGFFKGNVRSEISRAISHLNEKINIVKQYPENEKRIALLTLLDETTWRRKKSFISGSNSYGDINWAPHAVCESWLHELLKEENDIFELEKIIERISRRNPISRQIDKPGQLYKSNVLLCDNCEKESYINISTFNFITDLPKCPHCNEIIKEENIKIAISVLETHSYMNNIGFVNLTKKYNSTDSASNLRDPTQCILWDYPEKIEDENNDSLFKIIETYSADNHLERALLECQECGQLYFFEYYEYVDYENGNDLQYETYIPISEPQFGKELNNQTPIELLKYFPRIQIDNLSKDHKACWNRNVDNNKNNISTTSSNNQPAEIIFVIGPPGPKELIDQISQWSINSNKSIETIWIKFVHDVFSKFHEKENDNDQSGLDILFSETLETNAQVLQATLSQMEYKGTLNPTILFYIKDIITTGNALGAIDWNDLKYTNLIASHLGYQFKANWVKTFINTQIQ